MNYEAVEFVDAADLWVQNNFCTANSINTSDNYFTAPHTCSTIKTLHLLSKSDNDLKWSCIDIMQILKSIVHLSLYKY